MSLDCFEDFPRQKKIPSDLVPDLPYQDRRDNCRNKSDSDFGIAKLGLGSSESEVAHCGQPRASGNGRSVHSSNRGLGKVVKASENLGHPSGVLDILVVRLSGKSFQLIQVHSRTESLASSGK